MKKYWDWIRKYIVDNRNWLTIFLLGLPFINDTYPTHYFIYVFIKDFLKIISFAVTVYLYVRKKKKISRLAYIAFAFEGVLLLSTLLNHPFSETKEWSRMFYDILSVGFFALLIQMYADEGKDLVKGLMLNYEIALYPCYLNIVFGVTPEGYYDKGLLNTLILWILPAMMLALLHILQTRKFIRSSCLLLVCILQVLAVKSTTMLLTLVGTFGLLAISYVLYRKKIKIPLALVFAVAILANLFVLFIYSGGAFPFIDFVIEKILGKSTTFTERDIIWKEAIRMIGEKPILGHGFLPVVYAKTSFNDAYIHSHNQLLQKLNESGIIGFVIFILFHLRLIVRIDKQKNSLGRLIAVSFLFGVFITYIVEAYKDFYLFYVIYFIAYYMKKIEASH